MNLQRLEARLRDLLEVRLLRSLSGQKPSDLMLRRIKRAMETNARIDAGGGRLAPNIYTVLIHTGTRERWQEPGLKDMLLDLIKTVASEASMRFDAPLAISYAEDTGIKPDEFRVVASYSTEAVGPTQDMPAEKTAEQHVEDLPTVPENAFLIVDGVKEYPLSQPVVNIGRRLDNDLVIDDPRVSRHHAQLRAIKDRFVLFDLDSSGGTFINGQRTSQTVLYPGDVISLAGVSLIFGQDMPLPQRDLGQTDPRSRAGAERPTAIIRSFPRDIRKNP